MAPSSMLVGKWTALGGSRLIAEKGIKGKILMLFILSEAFSVVPVVKILRKIENLEFIDICNNMEESCQEKDTTEL